MPWTFNPFTGSFDQKGLGGGGASYIDGEVATYADLPLDGSAALNSAWLVRTASGVWPVSRKQAGIYIRTATGGSNRDSDYTYAGTMPNVFSDSQFLLYDNTDTSKNLAFDLGNLPTETTRIVSGPAGNGQMLVEGQSIGGTTPAAVTATNLMANTRLALPSSAAGTPVAGDLYRVTDTLRYRDSSNTERLLLNATDNLSNLANAATARTNLGLGSSSAVTFGSLTANNGTLTASAPVLDLAQTWNNAATTFTGLRVNVTDTSSASASMLADFQVGGATRVYLTKDGFFGNTNVGISFRATGSFNRISFFSQGATRLLHNNNILLNESDGGYGWVTSGSPSSLSFDTGVFRDAAGTIGQRNGSNPQRYNLYGTYTSSTNFERLFLEYNSTATAFRLGTEKGSGGGTARNLEFATDGTSRWTIDSTGRLYPTGVTSSGGWELRGGWTTFREGTTNHISIVSGNITARNGGYFQWTAQSDSSNFSGDTLRLSRSAGGTLLLEAGTSTEHRFQFGGTTSSFPALKRSSAILQARLADDSGYTTIDALHRLQGTAPATTGATGTAGDIRYDADYIYVCTATNTWKRAAIATW